MVQRIRPSRSGTRLSGPVDMGSLLKAEPARPDQPADGGPQPADRASLSPLLLAWYDRHRRILPWRSPPGERADPYRVWLSEIMLQQTTVATVGPYFHSFTTRWPTVGALAAAELDSVLAAWAGLGYYARARNLHRCAQVVARDHAGHFPEDEQELRQLPGIGPYTAAAIAAIAFDRPATAMDGNVERVMARLFDVRDPLPGVKPRLKLLADSLVPDRRPGDYTQALFDLGATVCTPRRPRCGDCPVAALCRARAAGSAEELPAKAAKAAKPLRRGIAFFITDHAGRILLRRRAEEGLLGGMMEVPSTPWGATVPTVAQAAADAPVALATWHALPGLVRHTFTHFQLELAVISARSAVGEVPPGCRWVPPDRLGDEALPTVMRKLVRHALAGRLPEGGLFRESGSNG